jgi:hypothetical protein
MAYLVAQNQPILMQKLVRTKFDLPVNFPAVKILDRLIDEHRNEICQNTWNKMFVISEHVNKFSVYGDTIAVNGLLEVAKLVSHLMSHFGLPTDEVTDENISVKFHHAKFTLQREHVHPFFCVHRDDYGGVHYPVHTFIVYRTFDLVEGNFGFYDDGYGNETPTPTEIINIQDSPEGFVKAIMFDGKLNHNALPLISGERYALSFQIKKLNGPTLFI